MDNYSFIANSEISYIESLYQSYTADPQSVSKDWQQFFEGFDFSRRYAPGVNGTSVTNEVTRTTADAAKINKEVEVDHLIGGYRSRGHVWDKTNPIGKRKDRGRHLA